MRRVVTRWLAVLAGLAACLTPTGTAPSWAGTTYQMGGATFRYPEGWYAAEFYQHARGPTSLGPSLSNRPTSDPCRRPRPSLIICDSPLVEYLRRGDAVAQWYSARNDGRGWHVDSRGWTAWWPTGYMAQVHISPASRDCRKIGGSENMNISVARDVHEATYTLTACLAGPEAERWIERIARSLRIGG